MSDEPSRTRRRGDVLQTDCGWSVDTLKEHFEAILAQRDRALEVASDEREKSALALASEREKAAQALAISLAQSIAQGDTNLRNHMEQQVEQLKALIESMRREMEIIHEASEAAISKAEMATEKRFESVNEWRGQSLDRERSQQEQTQTLASTFLPREVADKEFANLRKQLADLTERIGRIA